MNTLPVDGAARYRYAELLDFATAMLEHVGVDKKKAEAMSARMLDADLLGHRTHGLWFLSTYLERLTGGHIRGTGSIDVVLDEPTAVAWQGNRLPGAWVMEQATTLILDRLADHATMTLTISDCSHIGSLQNYLLPFTERGFIAILNATNAGVASVAPPSGTLPIITTNPMAMGIPSNGAPILIDQSTSVGSNALFQSYAARGERLPGEWLLDAQGHPSVDPSVLTADPPGTILPLGQTDFGYKGFGFGLMCEALSLALPGCGRSTRPDRFGQGVFMQVIDPGKFGGRESFLAEIDFLIEQVAADPGVDGKRPRLPGERALSLREEQLDYGVLLSSEVLERLAPWTASSGINVPETLH